MGCVIPTVEGTLFVFVRRVQASPCPWWWRAVSASLTSMVSEIWTLLPLACPTPPRLEGRGWEGGLVHTSFLSSHRPAA